MTFDQFNQFCASLPATHYVMQWRGSHVWKVGEKVFAIGNKGKQNQPAFSFKVSLQNYDFLLNCPGYQGAPYLANRGMKWIQAYDCNADTQEALCYYLSESYRIVLSGLSQKKQKALGLHSVK